jgi:hypothetical protein
MTSTRTISFTLDGELVSTRIAALAAHFLDSTAGALASNAVH